MKISVTTNIDTLKNLVAILKQKMDMGHTQLVVGDLNKQIVSTSFFEAHNKNKTVATYLKY